MSPRAEEVASEQAASELVVSELVVSALLATALVASALVASDGAVRVSPGAQPGGALRVPELSPSGQLQVPAAPMLPLPPDHPITRSPRSGSPLS